MGTYLIDRYLVVIMFVTINVLFGHNNISISEKETNIIFNKKIKEKFKINFDISFVYKYVDKEGVHYLLVSRNEYLLRNKIDYKVNKIKLFLFYKKNKKLILKTTLYDLGENIEIDNIEFKDIDKDGVKEVLVEYKNEIGGSNDYYKIFYFFKNEKILYRHYNRYAKFDIKGEILPSIILKYLYPHLILNDYYFMKKDSRYIYYSYDVDDDFPWIEKNFKRKRK